MPPTEEVKVKENIIELEDLIDSADVVFLLTDTRESRWLPTLMCSAKHKVLLLNYFYFTVYSRNFTVFSRNFIVCSRNFTARSSNLTDPSSDLHKQRARVRHLPGDEARC